MVTTRTGGSDSAGGSAVFAPVQHPILRSVDPTKVAVFLREWDRYVDEVEEKKKEVPSMSVASFKVSVDRGLLRTMYDLGRMDEFAQETDFAELTSTQIESYVNSIVNKSDGSQVNPAIIREALKGIRVPLTVADPEARMLEYVHDILERLDGVGYGNFKKTNPEKTIKLIQNNLYPASLKSAMADHLDYQEGLKKKLKDYVSTLCQEAVLHDKIRPPKPANGDESGLRGKSRDISRDKPWKEKSGGGDRKPDSAAGGSRSLLCLNSVCRNNGVTHVGGVRNCPNTTSEQAAELVKEHARKMRQKRAKKVNDLPTDPKMNSTVMGATFAGKLTQVVCADGGSDINLMPPILFSALLEARSDMKVKTFEEPRKYGLAASTSFVHCSREVTLDLELHIRHGKSLMIRNIKWLVADEQVDEPLLGRPIQEALGLNTKEILEAACDRYCGTVNAADLLEAEEYRDGSVARIMTTGMFHSDHGSADGDVPLGGQRVELGIDSTEELSAALGSMVSKAKENGMSEAGILRLHNLLEEYRDVFRVRLGPGPPALVEPMKVRIKEGAASFIARGRRYPPDQRDYITRFCNTLVYYGMAIPNTNAEWAAAPLIVAKSTPGKYRLTFDLRRVNQATAPMTWPMPHIQAELMDFSGSRVFASIDFCAGYWQMPLHADSQGFHSFVTPSGVYQPTRTLQGAMNSVQNFQSRVQPCFQSMEGSLKAWIDDFAVHADTEENLIDKLWEFCKICRERNLKISAVKTNLFDSVLRWCGYMIDEDGVQCDPHRLSGLRYANYPVNAAELSQFVHCLQWMSGFIPDFANRVKILKETLEEAYRISGKRTSKSVQRVLLPQLSWGPEHEAAFDDLQEQLRQLVKVSHRYPDKCICIYTDASDEYWAGVVTQCDPSCLTMPLEEQMHEPLAFLGSAFNSTQQHWSTFEREAYAVFQSFEKLDYMLACESNIHLFTDHRNLLFVYNPLALRPSLGRHIVNKVQRWALYLSMFMYTIEHVEGSKNVAADMLTRWFAGYRGKRKVARRITSLLRESDIIDSPRDETFVWPTADLVIKSQRKSEHRPKDLIASDGIWLLNGKAWIPSEDSSLQMKLIVTSHCGTAGHRAVDGTLSILKENYVWEGMHDDVAVFVANCLHCILSRNGNRIPRPLSSTLHAKKPNEVVHFDYIFMGKGCDGLKYCLVIKDDVSRYIWICPCQHADAKTTAKELLKWIRVFTPMQFWISDQGSHFKNEVIEHLSKEHHITHNFTVAYSPWTNGTIENCMRHIRAACTALLSEFKFGPQDWPLVIDIVMSSLNEAPLVSLGKREDGTLRTPLEVMTGIRPNRKTLGVQSSNSKARPVSISVVRAQQILNISELQGSIESMHRDVVAKATKTRQRQIAHHNKQTNIVEPNFSVGDFVVVRRAQDKGHKLAFRWLGPRKITRVIGDTVYEVSGLADEKQEIVHASRLLLYRSDLDGSQISTKLMEQAEHIESRFEMIEKLLDIATTDEGTFVQVQWLGQPDRTDWTWQPIAELYEDVPERVKSFLTKSRKRVAKQALEDLGLSN